MSPQRSVPSRRLVIDASVARAAGEPESSACRRVLDRVYEICHRMVHSHRIFEEWKRHESSYARAWRVRMISHRKLVSVGDAFPDHLQDKIFEGTETTSRQRREIQKDLHLVGAALETDRTVISCDRAIRRMFGARAAQVEELAGIVWVDPERPEETCERWLEEGAPDEPARRLSAGSRD